MRRSLRERFSMCLCVCVAVCLCAIQLEKVKLISNSIPVSLQSTKGAVCVCAWWCCPAHVSQCVLVQEPRNAVDTVNLLLNNSRTTFPSCVFNDTACAAVSMLLRQKEEQVDGFGHTVFRNQIWSMLFCICFLNGLKCKNLWRIYCFHETWWIVRLCPIGLFFTCPISLTLSGVKTRTRPIKSVIVLTVDFDIKYTPVKANSQVQ